MNEEVGMEWWNPEVEMDVQERIAKFELRRERFCLQMKYAKNKEHFNRLIKRTEFILLCLKLGGHMPTDVDWKLVEAGE